MAAVGTKVEDEGDTCVFLMTSGRIGGWEAEGEKG